ncbi:sensor histidine kinase [Stutzerimonas nosocomialis]|uniref:C4-dicarboxylate transport sensor protein DctB n=1 Tax=Stutzerimonas nosocomialis TaxID=1056496 RepID=A0A5R9QCF5_9GAMM|nr:ATP-binding protein [Stutzerimonas nosocomialis]TLX57644.1 sensor histidine kinase [Stutzerimonas nosocomialis]TLX62443.1 sensor histidine kinase [Stutzerimonas nosocomialis]
MPVLPRSRSFLPITLLILLGLAISLYGAGQFAERRAWSERSLEARGQLELYGQAIHTLVERFRSVPALLALDSDIRQLLESPDDQVLRQLLNERLEQQNQAAGSAVLYLLDAQGLTIAASNWREWTSFVGNNYSFRPYFRDAMSDGAGRYFAVGVTTGIPGYFLSHAVKDEQGRSLGVLVVKLELEEMQRDWVGQPGILLVADSLDIVILTNRPAWRFRHLSPLSDANRERLVAARRYAEQNLQPLESQLLARLDESSEQRRVNGPDGRRNYLWQHLSLVEEGWTLHLLQEPQTIAESVRSYRLAAAGVWMTLAFLLLFLAQRRKTRRLEARSRSELEQLVQARTAELRTAQDELVHAARMAALGQMSAAMAHEINQPLTALRMQLGSLRLLLDHQRTEEVRDGLVQVEGLLERMAALTGHLKTFARKSPGGLHERLNLAHVLDQALQLLAPRIRSDAVEVIVRLPKDAEVIGNGIRLEQVLINLLQNALDAMAGRERRQLRISGRREGDSWVISVADTGGGVVGDDLEKVFEPFYTTKPVGQGLGLGLAVSYGIVRDLGGSLEVSNDELGAVFTLRLAAAPAQVPVT